MRITNLNYRTDSIKTYKKKMPPVKKNSCYRYNALKILAEYNKAEIHFSGSEQTPDLLRLKSLNIPNFHIVSKNCVRGEALSSRKNRKFLSDVRNCGVKNIIDLRDKYTSTHFEDMCKTLGFTYYHIPLDSSSVDDNDIVENLPVLFTVLDDGGTYIACAQGLHRTDIALALNYLFNPKAKETPVMYGHLRNQGFKYDDIGRRINSIKKKITPQEASKLGWIENFEESFQKRKDDLINLNSNLAKEKKEVQTQN